MDDVDGSSKCTGRGVVAGRADERSSMHIYHDDPKHVGTVVELAQLENAKHYNGRIGKVLKYFPPESYAVSLFPIEGSKEKKRKRLKIRSKHLRRLLKCFNCKLTHRFNFLRDEDGKRMSNVVVCPGCKFSLDAITGGNISRDSRKIIERDYAMHEIVRSSKKELAEDPVFENCRLLVNIFEENGSKRIMDDTTGEENAIATVICENGVHIDHVHAWGPMKEHLKDLLGVWTDNASDEDSRTHYEGVAERINTEMVESETSYNVKIPIQLPLDPRKPLQCWRCEINSTVNKHFTHKLVFKTHLCGILIKWCDAILHPHTKESKKLRRRNPSTIRILQTSWDIYKSITIPHKKTMSYTICSPIYGDGGSAEKGSKPTGFMVTGIGTRLSASSLLFPPRKVRQKVKIGHLAFGSKKKGRGTT
eukprot:g1409.t1